MVKRPVALAAEDAAKINGLKAMILRAEVDRPGMVMTSFGMAMQKFLVSYHSYNWYEQLVDLATAFEAAISGQDASDVLLRLRSRSAALLATPDDPPAAIFADVGRLYALRSSLVHGGEVKETKLRNTVYGISTVADDGMFGIALVRACDRLRDLVRRALLMRIALASTDPPVWPLGQDKDVDQALTDDKTRSAWRDAWHGGLSAIGAAASIERLPPAMDMFTPGYIEDY
jgi:hypothetical protein